MKLRFAAVLSACAVLVASAYAVWLMPAGLIIMPSPFLLPTGSHLFAAAFVWIGWCTFVASRSAVPSAFAEWR